MSNQEDDQEKIDDIDSSEIAFQKSDSSTGKKSEYSKSAAELDLEDLPEEAQAVMKMILSSRSISTRSSALSNSLSDKINTAHISKMLDIAEQDNEREFEDIKSIRLYNLVTLVELGVHPSFAISRKTWQLFKLGKD